MPPRSLLLLLLCVVVAPFAVQAQLSFEKIEGTNTFCDTGPDAMTSALSRLTNGQIIPQHCVKVPASTGPAQQKDRCYYLFVPDCATGPVPIMMNLHGASSCPIWSTFFDRWSETALTHCFAVMFPNGVLDPEVTDYPCYAIPGGRGVGGLFTTNDCCCRKDGKRIPPSDTQDLAVLREMVDDVVFENRIEAASHGTASADPTRLYMTGHSNGCVAALALAATFHDTVAAVACHSAGAFFRIPQDYRPVPTWLAQGKKDDAIWFQFAQETYRTYGWVHECQNETSVDIDENGTGVEYTNYNCTNNASVTLLLLNESGHIPFLNGFEVSEDAQKTRIDTTEMAYQFCQQYAKDEPPESLVTRRSSTKSAAASSRFATETSLLWTSSLVLLLWFKS